MNKTIILITCLLVVTCSSSKDVVIRLTNPQVYPAIAYTGFYFDTETNDTTVLDGTTPREYMFTVGKNDVIEGSVHKDGPDVIDTLMVEILVDEETLLVNTVTVPSNNIDFTITGN